MRIIFWSPLLTTAVGPLLLVNVGSADGLSEHS